MCNIVEQSLISHAKFVGMLHEILEHIDALCLAGCKIAKLPDDNRYSVTLRQIRTYAEDRSARYAA